MVTRTIMLGRLQLREDLVVSENGERATQLTGQESIPRLSAAAIQRRREDVLAMVGQFVPVTFTTKSYLNGYYEVADVSGTIEDWESSLITFRWQLTLNRIGTQSDTDIESRLSGALTRVNDFAVVGERSHAPAIVHSSYWTDGTVTSAVSRTGEDGLLKLYRGLGVNTSPRWATTPAGYLTGRVRFTDELGLERAGDASWLPALGWTLSNGLVRIRPLSSGGVLEVAAYTGGAWHTKAWDLTFNAVSVGTFTECMLINNGPELVTLRLLKAMTNGRLYLDVTLRRGHRFAEVYVQSEFGGTIKLVRAAAEAGTNSTAGTVVATANDVDGNKYIVGSARAFTADVVNGGISKAATASLDAFIGVVAGGTGAVVGDQVLDLQKQYMGLPSELVQGVRR